MTAKKEKDSSKSDSASVKNKLKEKVTSGSGSGSEKSHKSSPSGSGSESKHKRSGVDGGEKEKKLKKIKREKADIYPADWWAEQTTDLIIMFLEENRIECTDFLISFVNYDVYILFHLASSL